MCKDQMLRSLVTQRLTAAAEEIFGLFERTMAEYEEELCRSQEENKRHRKLLDAVLSPQVRLHRADVQQLLVVKEESPPEWQEWSLDQEDPEPPHIAEHQKELWTSRDREQLHGLHESDNKFLFTPVPVKSEDDDDDDDEEKPQSSQLPDRNSGSPLRPATHDAASPSSESETDNSRDWEETKEHQSGLNLLLHYEIPVNDVTSVSSSGCTRRFGHKEYLQKHTGIPPGEKPFGCSVCGQRFTLKRNLKRHTTLHTGEKPFGCSVCGQRFTLKRNLKRHTTLHTGEKPFSCAVCRTSFAHREHLRQHVTNHVREKPFSCSVCGQRFTLKRNLQRHLSLHTGEKPFSCSFCFKRFAQSSCLSKHLILHTGEKPFSCSVCGQRFTLKRNLKRHSILHTGEKPFSCSVCGKRFTQKEHVRKHSTVHMGGSICLQR